MAGGGSGLSGLGKEVEVRLQLKMKWKWKSFLKTPKGHFQIVEKAKTVVQAYLKDLTGSVPDHCIKASIAINLSRNVFPGGGSCVQFFKKLDTCETQKVKYNKTRYACSWIEDMEREFLLLLLVVS